MLAVNIGNSQSTPQHVWSGRIQSTNSNVEAVGSKMDAQGNIYLVGHYQGTTDLDPGPGVVTANSFFSSGTYYSFTYLVKLDKFGVFQWAKSFNSSNFGTNIPADIDVRPNGKVIVAGYFYGDLTINGVTLSGASNGQYPNNGYAVVFNPDGTTHKFARILGTYTTSGALWNNVYVQSTCFDPKGNIIIAGNTVGNTGATASDLDYFSTTNVVALNPNTGYIAKYDSNFNYISHKILPTTTTAQLNIYQVKSTNDSIYISGKSNNFGIDFNNGATPTNVATGNGNNFVAAYKSSNLSNIWAIRNVGTDQSIAINPTGGLALVLSTTASPYDADPTISGVYSLATGPNQSIVSLHFNEGTGALVTTGLKKPRRITDSLIGVRLDLGGIDIDKSGSLYISGIVTTGATGIQKIDFNPTTDTFFKYINAAGSGYGDNFFAKYKADNSLSLAHVIPFARHDETMKNIHAIDTSSFVITSRYNGVSASVQFNLMNTTPAIGTNAAWNALYAKYTTDPCSINIANVFSDSIQSCVLNLNATATSSTTPISYQWYKNGVIRTADTNATFSTNLDGDYQCLVKNACNVQWTKKVNFKILNDYFENHTLSLDGNTSDGNLAGNTATITSTALSYVKDRFGVDNKAASFNGTSSMITAASPVFGRGVSLWFKRANTTVRKSMALVSYDAVTPGSWNPIMYLDSSGTLCGYVWPGNGSQIISSGKVNDTLWHHAVWTYDSIRARQYLYLDGVEVGNRTSPALVPGTATLFKIGNGYLGAMTNVTNPATTNQYFIGQIDNVKILYGALQLGNVLQLKNEIIVYNTNPANTSINTCAGNQLTLSTTVAADNYIYNGTNYSGANTHTINITSVTASTGFLPYNFGLTNSFCVTKNVNFGVRGLTTQPAIISTQPVSKTTCIGSNTFLSVVADRVSSYQWKKNGVNISNTNNDTLYLNNVSSTDFATYKCFLTGCGGQIDSTSAATLTQATGNISIQFQPASVYSCLAGTALFKVTTAGATPTYQWKKNGANISGKTADSLFLTGLSLSDSGVYTCDIMGGNCGTITTNPVNLFMYSPQVPAISPATASICVGDSINATVTGGIGNQYYWSGAISWAGSAVTLKPAVTSTYIVRAPNAGCQAYDTLIVIVNAKPTVNILPSASLTICEGKSTTLKATGAASYAWSHSGGNLDSAIFSPVSTITYTVTGTSNGCSNTASKLVTVNPKPNVSFIPSGAVATCSGLPKTIKASGGTSYIWSNGGGNQDSATFSPTTNTSYTVTATNSFSCTASASKSITVNLLPNITLVASSDTICKNNSSTLTANGGQTYSWSGGLSGTSNMVTPLSTTTYMITGTDANGCSNSTSKKVVVRNITAVLTQPSAQSTCIGGNVIFISEAAGSSLSYQWKKNGTNISGANSPNLSINSATMSDTGNYSVDITGACGNVSSIPAKLTVTGSLQISQQPMSASVCAGSDKWLTVIANGANVNYVWKRNGTTIPNSNNDSLLISNVSSANVGNYTCDITSSCGNVSSNQATISLLQKSTTTLTKSLCFGQTESFNGNTLTQSGIYFDTLSNSVGCDSIITFNLTILPQISTTLNQTLCNGSTIVFNGQTITTAGQFKDTLVSAFGCDSFVVLNTTLSNNSSSIINHTACESYNFNGNIKTNSGTYYDTLVNSGGCDSFITLNLTVHRNSSSTIFDTVCFGSSLSFGSQTITSSGSYSRTVTNSSGCDSVITLKLYVRPDLNISITNNAGSLTATSGFTRYQWFLNGSVIPSATNSNYNPSISGTYNVKVSDNYGCEKSSPNFNYTSSSVVSLLDNFEVSIYPNPASDYIQISNLPINNTYLYKIVDMVGKNHDITVEGERLNIDKLSVGSYVLIISNESVSYSIKFNKH